MVTTLHRPETETAVNTATRWVLVVEYDGTGYYGFQLQADRATVQAELEKAIKDLTGERVRIAASSRTDTGVHARGQVITFKTNSALPLEAYVHGLNHRLPDSIAVKSAHKTALSFDARRMAISREYEYSILNSATRSPLTERFVHRIACVLDDRAMDEACRVLLGTHDFASFASNIADEPERSTVRYVFKAGVKREHELITFNIVANAFVRHQVRNTAGALVQVGMGKMSMVEFAHLLEKRQPGLAGPTIPACGLCLLRVNYPATFEEMR
jgi:tRNA pseudouridine38-40 synthase